MNTKVSKILLLVVAMWQAYACAEIKHAEWKWPTVFIAILVRNKAHTLPYFLTCLHNLDYPKDNIHIWAYTDYTEDNSLEQLEKWSLKYGAQYHGVNITSNESIGPLHEDEEKPSHWSPDHFRHVIRLRDEALDVARKKWAEYIFMLDADVFLTNPNTLKLLVSKNLKIVAPMLISDGVYSNFWCGMTEQYYYKRTDKYRPILSRDEIGCFPVPMVHSAVLVNLKLIVSDSITYDPRKIKNYNGPEDDIIAFAINAKNLGLPLNICNDNIYGFVPVPLDDNADLTVDKEQLLNVKLEAIGQGHPLPLDPMFEDHIAYPEMWKFNCDQIYMINLERRVERRTMMERSLKELGMDAKIIKAVDGRELDLNHLEKFSVTFMPNYEDPFHKRPMKAGEVGCFLSHYNIWEEIIELGYETALVLEDDVHFTPFFRHKFLNLLKELEDFDWDLVYIGRKILLDADEVAVSKSMVRPLYSYWTLGYLVSQRGARKLVEAGPLRKMLPVDEYLPIMFDQHPNATWKAHFPHRSLAAFSAAPLLVHPTHYTGEPGYISDTEDSTVLPAGAAARGERSEL